MVITKQTQIGGEGFQFSIWTWDALIINDVWQSPNIMIRVFASLLFYLSTSETSYRTFLVRIFYSKRYNWQPIFFQYTNPPSALGCWIALERCTATNGALSFLPGSHHIYPVTKRFVRLGEGKGTGFEQLPLTSKEEELSKQPKGEYILETCNPGEQL